jgi:hypothetical protein
MGSILQYIIRKASTHDLGVNTVVVCVCNFPNCPRTTIYEASEREMKSSRRSHDSTAIEKNIRQPVTA